MPRPKNQSQSNKRTPAQSGLRPRPQSQTRKPPTRRNQPPPRRSALPIVAVFLLVSMVVVLLLPFGGGGDITSNQIPSAPTERQPISVDLFFRDNDGDWQREPRSIEWSDNRLDMAHRVLQGLLEGPRTPNLQPSIPPGVFVDALRLEVIEDREELDAPHILRVDFSGSFAEVAPLERTFTMASFVWSFTELDFINDLMFYIGGQAMLDGNQNPFGLRNRDNTTLEESPPPWEVETAIAVLYFPNYQMTRLVAEVREVNINPLMGRTYAAIHAKIAALISGPQTAGLDRSLPPDITYRSIRVDGDIVFIDFTPDFLNSLVGGSAAEEMLIFSLVNTLTELPEIRRVQILIDGLPISDDDSGFHIELGRALERDESLIDAGD